MSILTEWVNWYTKKARLQQWLLTYFDLLAYLANYVLVLTDFLAILRSWVCKQKYLILSSLLALCFPIYGSK